jgi:hypothetical protein
MSKYLTDHPDLTVLSTAIDKTLHRRLKINTVKQGVSMADLLSHALEAHLDKLDAIDDDEQNDRRTP